MFVYNFKLNGKLLAKISLVIMIIVVIFIIGFSVYKIVQESSKVQYSIAIPDVQHISTRKLY